MFGNSECVTGFEQLLRKSEIVKPQDEFTKAKKDPYEPINHNIRGVVF